MGVEDSHLQVPTSLGEAGPYVRGVAGVLTGELETLATQLAPLQETWTGTAYDYFYGLEQEWNMAALELFGDGQNQPGILGNVASALDVAWYNYVTTQNANTKTWMH